MDLNETPPALPEAAACSICLDPVEHSGPRSVALLKCGHEFHLDCIGSAFNVKGKMECPNCRDIEEGNWLNANELEPSTDLSPNFGTGLTTYELHLSNFLTPINGSALQDYSEPIPQSWSSSRVTLGSSSAATSRGRRHGLRGHVQQPGPSATRSSPYPPTARRVQPRLVSIVSSIAASHTIIENPQPHDIPQARAANVQNNNFPNLDDSSRRADQPYSYILGWDTQWAPSAGQEGTSSSDQAQSSYLSRSTRDMLMPAFRSENADQPPPSDRIYPSP